MENFTYIVRQVRNTNCPSSADDVFGPTVQGDCRQGFDFTLLFEQTVLSIPPAFLLIIFAPWRILRLSKASVKTQSSPIHSAKTVTAFAYLALQLALLVLWSSDDQIRTRASLPAAVCNLLAALVVVVLSYFEHVRSIRPSFLLNVYLFFSLVFDLAQARTLYLLQDDTLKASIFSAGMGIKLTLLFLEAQGKATYLRPPFRSLPPEATSGIFNQSFFWWLNSLIITGFSRLLSLKDLYNIDAELKSEELRKRLQEAWDTRSKPEKRFSLLMSVFRALRWPLLLTVFPRITLIGFNFAQPFLITRALDFVSQPEDVSSANEGYGLIAAAFVIYLGISMSNVHYQHRLYRSITMFRGAMVAVIYDRALQLQAEAFDESAAITLMSTDVDRIATSIDDFHEVWARLIEVTLGIALLARQLGWVCIMPILLVAVCTALSSEVAKRIGGRQKTWVNAVQKRVSIISSALGSMKSLKMMGLGRIMSDIIQRQRLRELDFQKSFRWMIVWLNSVANVPSNVAPVLTFIIYAVQAKYRGMDSLGTTQAFTSLAILSLLTEPAAQLLASIPGTAAASGCFERIQAFLLSPSRNDGRISPGKHGCTPNHAGDIPLQTLQPSAFRLPDTAVSIRNASFRPSLSSELAVKDVDLELRLGSITMIVGPVGSGKSTLLRAILGELPCVTGAIHVATTRMAYCAQSPWLANCSIQQSIIGVVDTAPDIQWYEKVLWSCALDQDMTLLPHGDQSIIGSKGITLSGGQKQRVTLARAVYARQEITVLDDVFSALDARTERVVVDRLLGRNGILSQLKTTVILVTHATRHLPLADEIILLNAEGRISKRGSFKELSGEPSLNTALYSDTHQEDKEDAINEISPTKQPPPDDDEKLKDLTRQTGDFTIYKYWFKHIGWISAAIFLVFQTVQTFTATFPQVWLKFWTDDGGTVSAKYFIVYILLVLIALFAMGGSIWAMLILIAPETAAKLHYVLLRTVMSAPQSFFARTDRGKTLNRDPGYDLDREYTRNSGSSYFNDFMVLAQAALISTGSTYMATTIPFVLLGLYFLQHVYLRTSRQLRYLDLEAKSPIFTQFTETLDGLATIRAFGWEQASRNSNIKQLDASQKPYYLLYCIQRWLNLVLDLIVTALAVVVIALAVSLRSSTSPGLLGIALNNILNFNQYLSKLVTSWTQLETSLGAIARVKAFEEQTAMEAKPGEDIEPPNDWPTQGKVEIRYASASYEPERPVLRDITMLVEPGQKVGICGRTGSGKSTLLSVLLRLVDMDDGSIIIDGLDLAQLTRESIRERLIAVPQDAFILNGTVRLNADPTSVFTDAEIMSALEKVQLWTLLSARGGLNCDLLQHPLSHGQQQLFCLSRAILRGHSSRILVLDEATSNVDLETDRLIQKVVREEFAKHTILTVAHRLETIMDADRVAVLDGGRLIEYGEPKSLLAQEGSAFAALNVSNGVPADEGS